MEQLVQKDANKPFRLMKLYKRLNLFQLQQFELESIQREHTQSEEEKTLHEYRNRINEYEKLLTNGKNWEYYKKVVNPFEFR